MCVHTDVCVCTSMCVGVGVCVCVCNSVAYLQNEDKVVDRLVPVVEVVLGAALALGVELEFLDHTRVLDEA